MRKSLHRSVNHRLSSVHSDIFRCYGTVFYPVQYSTVQYSTVQAFSHSLVLIPLQHNNILNFAGFVKFSHVFELNI